MTGMTEDEVWEQAAASLGMSGDRLEWLVEMIKPFRHADTVNIDEPVTVYADPDGADTWEVEVTGNMTVTVDGVTLYTEFRMRNLAVGKEWWRGSCQVPDRYKIVVDGEVVFDREVANPAPDDPDDDVGWERYQVFNPIRLEAWDAATAMVYTDRITRRMIGRS